MKKVFIFSIPIIFLGIGFLVLQNQKTEETNETPVTTNEVNGDITGKTAVITNSALNVYNTNPTVSATILNPVTSVLVYTNSNVLSVSGNVTVSNLIFVLIFVIHSLKTIMVHIH